MKKIYNAPTTVSQRLNAKSPMLSVSYTDNDDTDIKNIDIDTEYSGSGQLVRKENIWDVEW